MTNAPDVDRLAGELNAWSDHALGGPARLEAWLRVMIARGASDLLLVAGLPASIRVDGTITALSEGSLDGADIETAVLDALPAVAARRYQQGTRPTRRWPSLASVGFVSTCTASEVARRPPSGRCRRGRRRSPSWACRRMWSGCRISHSDWS
jgi:hypothetical protein